MRPITLALLAAAALGVTVWNMTRRPRASVIPAPSPASTAAPSLHPDSPFKETHMTHLTIIDAGSLERARQLECLGFPGIQLQFTQNTNFTSTWKLLV